MQTFSIADIRKTLNCTEHDMAKSNQSLAMHAGLISFYQRNGQIIQIFDHHILRMFPVESDFPIKQFDSKSVIISDKILTTCKGEDGIYYLTEFLWIDMKFRRICPVRGWGVATDGTFVYTRTSDTWELIGRNLSALGFPDHQHVAPKTYQFPGTDIDVLVSFGGMAIVQNDARDKMVFEIVGGQMNMLQARKIVEFIGGAFRSFIQKQEVWMELQEDLDYVEAEPSSQLKIDRHGTNTFPHMTKKFDKIYYCFLTQKKGDFCREGYFMMKWPQYLDELAQDPKLFTHWLSDLISLKSKNGQDLLEFIKKSRYIELTSENPRPIKSNDEQFNTLRSSQVELPSSQPTPAQIQNSNQKPSGFTIEQKDWNNDYRVVRKIGKGAAGIVVLVEHKKTGQQFALKQIDISTDADIKSFKNEATAMMMMDHPNVIKLYKVFYHNEEVYFLLEFARGGDLQKFIETRKKANIPIDLTVVLLILAQIILGMDHLHQKLVIHRDLKPLNIFINELKADSIMKHFVQIGDFGIGSILNTAHTRTFSGSGTLVYMPPEQFYSRPQDFKVDAWALGCILYQMCTLDLLYHSLAELEQSFRESVLPVPRLPQAYAELQPVYEALLQFDPLKRISITELKDSNISSKLRAMLDLVMQYYNQK